MMPRLTSDEYAREGGSNCPACGSTDIYTEMTLGQFGVPQDGCEECGATWQRVVDVTGYCELTDKDGNPIEED